MNRCYIVPPYLLRHVASSSANSDPIRASASQALREQGRVIASRANRMSVFTAPRGARGDTWARLNSHQSIVPEVLLRQISESDQVDDAIRQQARIDLEQIRQVTDRYKASQESGSPQQAIVAVESLEGAASQAPKVYRGIYDAKHVMDESFLPGSLVRAEGQKPVKDQAVNETYTNFGHVYDFYQKYFQWNSIDNRGMHIIASCHFGQNYENACKWIDPVFWRLS